MQVYLDNLSDTAYRPLYNGNIAGMAVSIKFPNATAVQVPQYYNYKYDQLNRLTQMDVHRGFNASTNSWSGLTQPLNDYQERIAYDANGNILKYLRNGTAAPNINMDNLTYNYYPNTNRLKYVQDNVADANYADDIDNQTNTSNYSYDQIGNIVTDAKELITSIKWNVYGKITEITKKDSTGNIGRIKAITYTYDASGNRISKKIEKYTTTTIDYTWYVRDASGNVMSTYNGTGTNAVTSAYTLNLTEQHMYGSSRLGILNRNISVKSAFVKPTVVNFTRGNKFFELSNHLGNVLVTVSDKKIPVASTTNPNVIDYYNADVITANDYAPFGSLLTGRNYNAPGAKDARYGFNGKENDNEVKGEGNQQDYGMRIYDPRLGRFLSVDPITSKYPNLTPYQFASNSPIANNDEDGLEAVYYSTTIKFITNYQILPDGSTKNWSSQEVVPEVTEKTGLLHPNGPSGSGNMYTIRTQISERFLDVNGMTTGHCDETPIVANRIYEPSRADLMKDVKNRPIFEGDVQLIIFGSAVTNEDSPGSQANINAKTYSINMKAFNEYLKPIMMGITLKTPMEYKGPTLENLASNNMKAATSNPENSGNTQQSGVNKAPMIWNYIRQKSMDTSGNDQFTKPLGKDSFIFFNPNMDKTGKNLGDPDTGKVIIFKSPVIIN